MQRHKVTSLETARSLANGPSWGGGGGVRKKYVFSVSDLSFVYGRSLWAELNGGGNSLHWKANMLPLFSIMTLWDHSPPLLNSLSTHNWCCYYTVKALQISNGGDIWHRVVCGCSNNATNIIWPPLVNR